MSLSLPPLCLYIHYPWCVRKCPYCDFNSYPCGADSERDQLYFKKLGEDLNSLEAYRQGRFFESVYFGGGTPSLCAPELVGAFLEKLSPYLSSNPEISLEANPGTIDAARMLSFRAAGITRLSLGIQSFEDDCLRALGRIHRRREALAACTAAAKIFDNFNCDLMHGLPGQHPESALSDLKLARSAGASHISWYELTIEEGTSFGVRPPVLPSEDERETIEMAGFAYLEHSGFKRYEVSAFARGEEWRCRHNLNYWHFGDYAGIGAGAHSKFFLHGCTWRRACPALPGEYLKTPPVLCHEVSSAQLPFEFMLNRLRVFADLYKSEFEERTGLQFAAAQPPLEQAAKLGLVEDHGSFLRLTLRGRQMLNYILRLYLE